MGMVEAMAGYTMLSLPSSTYFVDTGKVRAMIEPFLVGMA